MAGKEIAEEIYRYPVFGDEVDYDQDTGQATEAFVNSLYDNYDITSVPEDIDKVEFIGFDCRDSFCDWLFTPQNKNTYT